MPRFAPATPKFTDRAMNDADLRLLGPDDPGPVHLLRPEGSSDFLLTADHAGRAIPRRLGDLGLSARELSRHIAWDKVKTIEAGTIIIEA